MQLLVQTDQSYNDICCDIVTEIFKDQSSTNGIGSLKYLILILFRVLRLFWPVPGHPDQLLNIFYHGQWPQKPQDPISLIDKFIFNIDNPYEEIKYDTAATIKLVLDLFVEFFYKKYPHETIEFLVEQFKLVSEFDSSLSESDVKLTIPQAILFY